MDPRIQSIFATTDEEEENDVEGEKEDEDKVLITQTADEWIKKMGFTVWPMQVEEEKSLNLTPEDVGTGSLEDIMNELAADVPLDIGVMDEVLKQVEELEVKVNLYAAKILNIRVGETSMTNDGSEQPGEARSETPPLVRRYRDENETVLRSTRRPKELGALSYNSKSVENTTYFGFMSHELTALPGQLESQQLLNKVTKVQNFPRPFKAVWKKTILSNASVAVFQDSFWWLFCHNFQKDQPIDAIFSRISHSFVALFFSIPAGYRDQFFECYPNCLSQALYAAFCEAFPDSFRLLGDDFKSCLLDTVCEWVWGVKLPPQSWQSWQMHHLEPSEIRQPKKNAKSFQMSLSFDVDSIVLEEPVTSPSEKSKQAVSPARLFQLDQDDQQESHPAGPGPFFAKVKFNILGQSPLVSHFLSMKGLKQGDAEMVQKTVKRTEIARLPVALPTYRDLIDDCKRNSRSLSQQYRMVLQMSREESQRIQRQKQEALAKINQLENELTRKHSEFKTLSEKIYDIVLHSDYTHSS